MDNASGFPEALVQDFLDRLDELFRRVDEVRLRVDAADFARADGLFLRVDVRFRVDADFVLADDVFLRAEVRFREDAADFVRPDELFRRVDAADFVLADEVFRRVDVRFRVEADFVLAEEAFRRVDVRFRVDADFVLADEVFLRVEVRFRVDAADFARADELFRRVDELRLRLAVPVFARLVLVFFLERLAVFDRLVRLAFAPLVAPDLARADVLFRLDEAALRALDLRPVDPLAFARLDRRRRLGAAGWLGSSIELDPPTGADPPNSPPNVLDPPDPPVEDSPDPMRSSSPSSSF